MATNPYDTTPQQPQQPAGVLSSQNFDFNKVAGQMQGPTEYKPSDNALVSEQLNKLLNKNSTYLQAAQTRAMQTANSRGLANSSMAAGAGVLAATEAALPVAQQDASSYFTADRDNAARKNEFSMEGNRFGRENAQLQYKGVLEGEMQDKDFAFRKDEANTDRTWRTGEREADQAFRSTEADVERDWRTGERLSTQDFQSAEGAKEFSRKLEEMGYQNDLMLKRVPIEFATNVASNLQSQISAIMSNPELSKEAKESSIRNLVSYSNATMSWAENFYGGTFSRFSPTDTTLQAPSAPAPAPAPVAAPAPAPTDKKIPKPRAPLPSREDIYTNYY